MHTDIVMPYLIRFLFFLSAMFILVGCGKQASDLPIGKDVIVQFDRSTLGAAANVPIAPTTEGFNGAATSVRGTLIDVDPDWVRLENAQVHSSTHFKNTFWIPRSAVLMIQMQEATQL